MSKYRLWYLLNCNYKCTEFVQIVDEYTCLQNWVKGISNLFAVKITYGRAES